MTMFSDNGTPPEHDPFKDGEDIPKSEDKDTGIFRRAGR